MTRVSNAHGKAGRYNYTAEHLVGALEDLEDLFDLDHPLIGMNVIQGSYELLWIPLSKLVLQVVRVLQPRCYDNLRLRCSLRLPLQKLKNLSLHCLLRSKKFTEKTLLVSLAACT